MSTIEIRHRTRFKYSVEIPTSYNEARVIPAHLPRQRVLTSDVEITPVTWQTNYVDYWDTRVTAFEVLRPASLPDGHGHVSRGGDAGVRALAGARLE